MPSSSSHSPWRKTIPNSFFKVMAPGFRTKLDLPQSFCKHLRKLRSQKAVITSQKGSWKFDVCKRGENGQISLENGWDLFVKKHDLHLADFLLFQHLGNLSFHVQVFEFATKCIKQFVSTDKSGQVSNPDYSNNKRMKTEDESPTPENSYFSVKLKQSHGLTRRSPYMGIPLTFWRPNDLSKQRSVLLRGPSSKELQKVKLQMIRRKYATPQLVMTTGWHEFYESYNLQLGYVCHFKLDSTTNDSNVILDVEIDSQ